jgi:TPR repeat protein
MTQEMMEEISDCFNEIDAIFEQINFDGMKDDFKKAVEDYRKKKKEAEYMPPTDDGIQHSKILREPKMLELINPVLTLALRDPQESFYVGMELYNERYIRQGKSNELVIKLIMKASEGGVSNASYILAMFYLYGAYLFDMFRRNKKKHVYYLNLSYEQDNNNVYALNLLGAKYAKGFDGFEKDTKKAFECYSKASDLGYAYAQCNLSHFYLHGELVDKDVDKALDLLEKAAEAGDSTAMYNLWYLYSGKNKDVKKDIGKSNYWADKYNNRHV